MSQSEIIKIITLPAGTEINSGPHEDGEPYLLTAQTLLAIVGAGREIN